jgi:hypothetical protein
MCDAAPPDYEVVGIINRFAEAATARWKTLRVSSATRRTEFLFVGHRYGERDDGRVAMPFAITVTNFKDEGRDSEDAFRIESAPLAPGRIAAAGNYQALRGGPLDPTDDKARKWFTPNTPPKTVLANAVQAVRMAARSPAARGLVGGQATSIVIPLEPSQPVRSRYHTEHATRKMSEPSYVEARGGKKGVFAIMEPQMWVSDDAKGANSGRWQEEALPVWQWEQVQELPWPVTGRGQAVDVARQSLMS